MQRGTIRDKDGEREQSENILQHNIETVASNYVLEMTENKDISEKVIIETIKLNRGMQEELSQYLLSTYTGPPALY